MQRQFIARQGFNQNHPPSSTIGVDSLLAAECSILRVGRRLYTGGIYQLPLTVLICLRSHIQTRSQVPRNTNSVNQGCLVSTASPLTQLYHIPTASIGRVSDKQVTRRYRSLRGSQALHRPNDPPHAVAVAKGQSSGHGSTRHPLGCPAISLQNRPMGV